MSPSEEFVAEAPVTSLEQGIVDGITGNGGHRGRTVLEREDLDLLFAALAARGFTIIGPTVRDDAIVYDEITTSADLPIGWTDEQSRGGYRLRRRDDEALFGYAVGAHTWKRYLHPPRLMLWRARRNVTGLDIVEQGQEHRPLALIGVRPCELRAIEIQDRVFLGGPYVDPHYGERRRDVLVVAVNCTEPGGTCFCASMDAGPTAREGFDIALTEVIGKRRHFFAVEAGSERGEEICAELSARLVLTAMSPAESEKVDARAARAGRGMSRTVDTTDVSDLLARNAENPRWAHAAERCLTCGNCTMVCPTCFCTTVEDLTDLAGDNAERWRRWDSCFTVDYSYIHGGSVRTSARARYRHWITHKFGTWLDQFGTSGCTGCGRCITWCPAGIDITEELHAVRQTDVGG